MVQFSGKAAIAAFVALLALTSASRAAESFVVQERTVPDYKMVSATLTTRDMGEARARIGGTLIELRVREGDFGREGSDAGRDRRSKDRARSSSAQSASRSTESRT